MTNKTSIYILSILVLIVLGLSVILPSHQLIKLSWEGFSVGFETGWTGKDDMIDGTLLPLKFTPTTQTMIHPTDSIIFDDGMKVPIVVDSVAVLVPDAKLPSWTIWTMLITPLQFCLLAIILWKFLRFILNVSKSRIFVDQNVRYLRQISFALIAIAFVQLIGGLLQDYLFGLFSFAGEGYDISALWDFPWSNLLIGVVALLLAQVWAYGIKIKQDQELTI